MPRRQVRIKFCGMRRREDLQCAVDLGVDYVGFVLVPGTVRHVTEDEVLGMLDAVDCTRVCRVGVFRDQRLEEIERLVRRLSLDLVQLHGSETTVLTEQVSVPVIRMLPVPERHDTAAATTMAMAGPLAPAANLYAVLLDTRSATGASGGTGRLGHPQAIELLRRRFSRGRVFLAGGLTPDNVAAIVQQHRPDAVDVSSGIESRPGEKDPERMRAFVKALEEGGSR
jgi:phosphoribosylanthranilate isomerase